MSTLGYSARRVQRWCVIALALCCASCDANPVGYESARDLGVDAFAGADAFSIDSASPPRDSGSDPVDAGTPRDMGMRADAGVAPGERDPFLQPFASDSIWNMPIGSNAEYVAANIRTIPGGEWSWGLPFSDTDIIALTPDAPMTDVRYSSVGWSGGNRCSPTSSMVLASVPMPNDLIVANATHNYASAFLMPDMRTIVQVQPLARCSAGAVATSLVRVPDEDLYGDGIGGAHGGSGMSAIGGALRVGELRAGGEAPRHALKFTFYMKDGFRCTNSSECYRWPALRGDSYAVGFYGTAPGNPNVSNRAFVMGSLLAIPADVDLSSLGFESEPGEQLAWTLQNYGAYIVDDAYAEGFLIATETGPAGSFVEQFEDDYGYAFNQNSDANLGWRRDIQRILPALRVVDNNSPSSIGGGGTPLQPLAPELDEP